MQAISIWLIVGLFVILGYSRDGWAAQAVAEIKEPDISRALVTSGVLDAYQLDLVDEVLGQLMRVAREWPGYQVNGPYKRTYINVYLINSSRLPERALPVSPDLNLSKNELTNNAFTDESSATIFVDTGLLKEFVATVMYKLATGVQLVNALAEVRIQGLDNVRHLWDPAVNPRLRMRAPVENWLNFYRGMLGFVLAHEMGHIHIGRADANASTDAPILSAEQDADLRWACWDTLAARYKSLQQVEAQADNYAARLIAQILFPEGALRAPLLWYELGAQTFLTYTLNKQALEALNQTESNYFRKAMQIQLGPELYARLPAREGRRQGALHVVFPKRHPGSVRRIEHLLDTLSQSSYSYHHGQSSYATDLMALKMVIDPACAELKRKYSIP
jgi:hypothetical protein